tara:strand:+ start:532 stop:777 length:246 start_codon:yes stop_codon:yes gene_type:complete
MILYKKKTDENNILGYQYVYVDKDNHVFIEHTQSRIKSMDIQAKLWLGEIDDTDFMYTLELCYEIVHYGKLKFRKGQLDVY